MIITSVNLSAGENEVFVYGSEGEKFRITSADAKRTGIYKLVENPEMLPEEYDEEMLSFLTNKLSCVKYAEYLLEFGDKSKKALKMKLKTKYDEDACDAALDVLEKNGIIDDQRLCSSKLASIANAKLYGPYRLRQELIKKGFSSRQIDIAFDDCDMDFDENLNKLAEKLTLKGFPTDEKSFLALKNKLIRYGYSYENVALVLGELEE